MQKSSIIGPKLQHTTVHVLGNVAFEITPRKNQGGWQTIKLVVNAREFFYLGWNWLQLANSSDLIRLKQKYPEVLKALPDLLPQPPNYEKQIQRRFA